MPEDEKKQTTSDVQKETPVKPDIKPKHDRGQLNESQLPDFEFTPPPPPPPKKEESGDKK